MTDDVDANARQKAHALIQGYLGPDHKIRDMKAFYSALVQALKDARNLSRAASTFREQNRWNSDDGLQDRRRLLQDP